MSDYGKVQRKPSTPNI